MQKYPSAADKLALALILGRGNKPTLTKNRDLSLLDVDKLVSLKNKSLREEDISSENMKMAVELSGLKRSLGDHSANRMEESLDSRGGTFQIFRLVRAAQMHYLTNTRRRVERLDDVEMVNTSFTMEDD
jgi:hypothetical protein